LNLTEVKYFPKMKVRGFKKQFQTKISLSKQKAAWAIFFKNYHLDNFAVLVTFKSLFLSLHLYG